MNIALCVEPLQDALACGVAEVANLEARCHFLEKKVDLSAVQDVYTKSAMTIDRIKSSDKFVRFYTGFQSFLMFMACFNFLEPYAKVMRTWKGSTTVDDATERVGKKPGPQSKLPLMEQFFLVMVRLRLGLKQLDLAERFGIHQTTVSQNFIPWINLMDVQFRHLPLWLYRRKINRLMPTCFRTWYATTRVIINCTEFFIDIPSSLARQSATWSAYKNHNSA